MDWDRQVDVIREGHAERYVISNRHGPLPYSQVIDLWRDNEGFRDYFCDLLRSSSFPAYRWETPAVTTETINRPFEFVLLRCDALDRAVDKNAFAEHFDADSLVVTFSNLSGDSVLVAPCPSPDVQGDATIYGHLASVIRNAPKEQLHQIWQQVAHALRQRISARPVWLSTAGMGISWLHIRLDNRPKYYGYATYRSVDF